MYTDDYAIIGQGDARYTGKEGQLQVFLLMGFPHYKENVVL